MKVSNLKEAFYLLWMTKLDPNSYARVAHAVAEEIHCLLMALPIGIATSEGGESHGHTMSPSRV